MIAHKSFGGRFKWIIRLSSHKTTQQNQIHTRELEHKHRERANSHIVYKNNNMSSHLHLTSNIQPTNPFCFQPLYVNEFDIDVVLRKANRRNRRLGCRRRRRRCLTGLSFCASVHRQSSSSVCRVTARKVWGITLTGCWNGEIAVYSHKVYK